MGELVYFFSDAHLGAAAPQEEKTKQEALLAFLDQVKQEANYLYILGDLFEFWFEYRNVMPREHFDVLIKLKELVQHEVKITYIAGNHDFWLGDFLPEQIGIKVKKEPISVEHHGKRILVVHGDGLCSKDRGYRILKRIFRNKTNIWLYRQLPPDLGIPLAKKIAGLSRSHTSKKECQLDDYISFAKDKIDQGYHAVVMGHTHYPLMRNLGRGIFLNVGDWVENFTYGKLKESRFYLEKFSR